MRYLNQKGALHLVALILLAAGLVVGIYLVGRPTVFKSRAASESKLEVKGNFYQDGVATSRLLGVRPTYGGDGKPEYFRLSNQAVMDEGTVYKYTASDSERGYSLWNLDITAIDKYKLAKGKHTIFAQFLVDGVWTTPILTDIQLEKTNNDLGLAVTCDYAKFGGYGPYPIKVSWNSSAVGDADQLVMMMFRGSGGYVNEAGPMSTNEGTTTLYLPSIADNYSIFATTTKGDQSIGTSEYSFSCTDQDFAITLAEPTVSCDANSCKFSWLNRGPTPLFRELTTYLTDPLTNTIVSPIRQVGQTKEVTIGINNSAAAGSALVNGPYTRFGVIPLKQSSDLEASALVNKRSAFGPKFIVAGVLQIATGELGKTAGLSCQVIVAEPDGSGSRKVTYSGAGGKVRLWMSGSPAATQLSVDNIKLDKEPIIRELTSQETGATTYYYELANMDGSKSSVNQSHQLSVPKGQYNLHCDVLADNNGCTGKLSCEQEGKGGKVNCAQQGFPSCSNSDNAAISN